MRTVDKELFSEVPKANIRGRTKMPVDDKAAKQHRQRIEVIAARIQMDEEMLKSRKIKPYSEYSAGEFDELKETNNGR